MSLVGSVRIVKAKDTSIVHPKTMRQKEGEVVAHYLVFFIDPNLFAKNADTACAPELGLVVGLLAEVGPSTHIRTLTQMMHHAHRLKTTDYSQNFPKKRIPLNPNLRYTNSTF